MEFVRSGYWIKSLGDGDLSLLKVVDEYDTYLYEDGDWVSIPFCAKLGWDPEWSKISEQEALDALGIDEW